MAIMAWVVMKAMPGKGCHTAEVVNHYITIQLATQAAGGARTVEVEVAVLTSAMDALRDMEDLGKQLQLVGHVSCSHIARA